MSMDQSIKIESLDEIGTLCVLRDRRGNSLGTGSREVLEVLRYIVEQCEEANFYYGRSWNLNLSARTTTHHVNNQYAR